MPLPDEALNLGFATVEYQRSIAVEAEFGIKPQNESDLLAMVITTNHAIRRDGYVPLVGDDPTIDGTISRNGL